MRAKWMVGVPYCWLGEWRLLPSPLSSYQNTNRFCRKCVRAAPRSIGWKKISYSGTSANYPSGLKIHSRDAPHALLCSWKIQRPHQHSIKNYRNSKESGESSSECSLRIHMPEEHNFELEGSIPTYGCRFLRASFIHFDSLISQEQINCREYRSPTHIV